MSQAEGTVAGDWLKFEADPNYCREQRTLASGQDLDSGTVVALGAGTTVSAYIEDDGTYGTVHGILVDAVDASSAAAACTVIVRGPAVVDKSELTWHADNDSGEITTGEAALLALHIVCR